MGSLGEGVPAHGLVRRVIFSAYTSAVFAMFCWAGSFVTARGVYEQVPPIGLNYWRSVLAICLFLLIGHKQIRKDWPKIIAHWKVLVVLGFFLVVMGNTSIFIGLQTTTAINGGVINAISPVFVILLSLMILREPVTAYRAMGVGLALVGVALLITRADLRVLAALDFTPGDLWVVTAVLGWSLFAVFLKKWAPGLHFITLSTVATLIGTLWLTPIYLWEHLTVRQVPVSTTTFLAVLYLGAFASFLAVIAHTRAVQMIGPARTAPFSYAVPVFTIIAGVLFLGEALQPYHVIGIAVIAAGIYLTTRGGAAQGHGAPVKAAK